MGNSVSLPYTHELVKTFCF